MNKLKVGIAGIGFIGPAHIEALRRLPNVEVVSINHHRNETAKAKAAALGVSKYYTNFEAQIAHDDLDCIHIEFHIHRLQCIVGGTHNGPFNRQR